MAQREQRDEFGADPGRFTGRDRDDRSSAHGWIEIRAADWSGNDRAKLR
jgi:hypothetical protein